MNRLTHKQALIEARKLIEDQEYWTQGAYAKTNLGIEVSATDPEAYCFCLVGALYKVSGIDSENNPFDRGLLGYGKLVEALKLIGRGNIAIFNDVHTHREVLELLDQAIALT